MWYNLVNRFLRRDIIMNRRDFLKLSTMAAATPIVSAFGASNNDASSPKSTSGSALFRVKPYVQLF
jgi:hypothetical protein